MTTLDELLGELDAAGLIRQVRHDPDATYQFRHVLTQEAAYSSLLKQDRRRLHLLVGEALEREYANRLDEVAPILARHFDEAEDEARALDYHTRAGDAATARFANTEAAMHYRRAMAYAKRGHTTAERLIDLHLRYGRVLEISGHYAEALATYIEMEMLAQERDDKRMLLAALMARATIHAAPTVLNNSVEADSLAQRALLLASELNDRAAESKALWLRMMAHRFTEYDAAIVFGEQSAQIARELGLHEPLAYALNDIFTSYLLSGQANKGLAALEEAEQLWRKLDNPNMLADSLIGAGEMLYFMGRIEAGAAKIQEALQLSERTSNYWGQSYARWMLGEMLLEHADYAGAIATLHESMRLGAQAGFAISQIATHGHLALAYTELGAYDRGADEARKAIEMANTLKPEWQGLGHAVLALCQFYAGQRAEAHETLSLATQYASFFDLSIIVIENVKAEMGLADKKYVEVERNIREAFNMIRNYEMLIFEPYARYCLGMVLLKMGRADEAHVEFASTLALMNQLGMRRQIWRVQLAQAACDSLLGNDAEAAALRAAASTEVEAVAAELPTDLRTSFLRRIEAMKRDIGSAE